MNIKGLNFKMTCSASPEQYDVYDSSGKQVGYVRLRWGGLSCTYPDVCGEEIYYANVGSDYCGVFENNNQRMMYLNKIADKILKTTNVEKFLQDIDLVCMKHNLSISHEDGQGEFIIEGYNKYNIERLFHACKDYK